MTDLRKAAEMLMKVLDDGWVERGDSVVIALRQALAQPEQKLIGWNDGKPQYVAQPKPWVGLTIDESSDLYNKNYDLYATDMHIGDFIMIQREVEAKLKEKNFGS